MLFVVPRFSLILLLVYGALAAIILTIGFRVAKLAEARFKNVEASHPFRRQLETEVAVPQERIHTQVDVCIEHATALFLHLRHLFLVEDIVDSIKVNNTYMRLFYEC